MKRKKGSQIRLSKVMPFFRRKGGGFQEQPTMPQSGNEEATVLLKGKQNEAATTLIRENQGKATMLLSHAQAGKVSSADIVEQNFLHISECEEIPKEDWEEEKGRCLNCMELFDEEEEICPHCKAKRNMPPKELFFLYPGVILRKRYLVGSAISWGGFGILYRAWDRKLKAVVAIKEFFPSGLVNRVPGHKELILYTGQRKEEYQRLFSRFLEEARNTAKFNNSEYIVHVFDFFEENETAYMVMEYLDGISFKEELEQAPEGRVSWQRGLEVIFPVLEALRAIHNEGIIHRDISPDNIFICKDGRIKVLDFGAARFSEDSTEKDWLKIVKMGFAPLEQYRAGEPQGPWTDLYAVGATLYKAVTGKTPEESTDREEVDSLKSPKELLPELPVYLDRAIMKVMAMIPEYRFQKVEELRRVLEQGDNKLPQDLESEIKARRRNFRISIGAVVLLLAVGLLSGAWICYHRRIEATLEGLTLSIWVCVEEGERQEEEARFTEALQEFTENYPDVLLQISYIEEDYGAKLKQALQTGTAPDLFQSGSLEQDMDGYLADLKPVEELIALEDYYFFDHYEDYYPGRTRLPLGFDMAVTYTNTLAKGDTKADTLEEFLEEEKGSYIGTIRDYYEVQEALSGYYQVGVPMENRDGKFCNEWSVNGASGQFEQEAAFRVLYYLLGENGQNALYVLSHDTLPINKAIAKVWWEVYGEMDFVKEEISELSMTKEGEGS